MPLPLSERLSAIPDSAVSSIIRTAVDQSWTDAIPMAGGEPTFAVIEGALEAFRAFDEQALTKYSPFTGYPELLELLQAKLATVNGLRVARDELIVVPGGAAALWGAVSAVTDPGSEVVVTDPCWEHYHSIVRMTGAQPVAWTMFGGAMNGALDFDRLRALFTPRTRALLINTPLNPCGYVFSEQDLRTLVELCARHRVRLICDEEYETFVYGGRRHVSPRTFSTDAIVLHSMSKGFAMTGARVGYVVAPPEVVTLVRRAALYSYMYPSSTAQCLAIAVLRQDYVPYLAAVRDDYEARAGAFVDKLSTISGVEAESPPGGVYVFPKLRSVEGRSAARVLIEEDHLLCVPGEVAGASAAGRVRFFIGVPARAMDEAADRIRRRFALAST